MKLEPGNRVVMAPEALQAPGEPTMLVIATVLELNEARGRIAAEVDLRGGKDYFQVKPDCILRRSTPEDEATMPGGDLLPEGNVEVRLGPEGDEKKLTAREMDYLHALERGGARVRQDEMATALKKQLEDLNPATGQSPEAVAARRRELAGRILCSLIRIAGPFRLVKDPPPPGDDVDIMTLPDVAIILTDRLLLGLERNPIPVSIEPQLKGPADA